MSERHLSDEPGEPGDEIILEGLRDLGRYVDETHYPGLAWTAAPQGQTIRVWVWSAASAAAAAAIVLAGMLLWRSGESAQPPAPQDTAQSVPQGTPGGTPPIAGKTPRPTPGGRKTQPVVPSDRNDGTVVAADASTTAVGMDYNIPSVSYASPDCEWNIPSVSFPGTSRTSASESTTPATPPAGRQRSAAGRETGAKPGAA